MSSEMFWLWTVHLLYVHIFREIKCIYLISKSSWFFKLHTLTLLPSGLLLPLMTGLVCFVRIFVYHWSVHLVMFGSWFIFIICSRRLNNWSTRIRNSRMLFQKQHQHSTRAEVSRYSNSFPHFFIPISRIFLKFVLLG